jgi:hypothetical protein
MSTMFVCQLRNPSIVAYFELKPLASVKLNVSYINALRSWGLDPHHCFVLEHLGDQLLDDMISEAIDEAATREIFCSSLLAIVRECSVAAVWYAGFHDDLPVVSSPDDFVDSIRACLVRRDFEPSVRMVRPTES